MDLINNTTQLAKVIRDLEKYKFITLDTEFLRSKTYFPQFCLLQIATQNNAYVVDVLSPDIDCSKLKEIMLSKDVVKVLHSCKQDVQVLQQELGVVPNNIFDTQIAAGFCGLGDMASYTGLCKRLLNVKLDKTQRVTDWSKRPLDKEQVRYALNDVIYLIEIYQKLVALLAEQNKSKWAGEYMDRLSNPNHYKLEINNIWRKLSLPPIPKKARSYCKIIAIWREHKAQETNVPRRRFLRDQEMINIANHLAGLSQGTFKSEFYRKYGDEIKDFISEFKWKTNSEYEPKIMSLEQKKLYDLLRNLLSMKAGKYKIAKRLIATSEDLADLVWEGCTDSFDCMKGWRYDIFGSSAREIISKNSPV